MTGGELVAVSVAGLVGAAVVTLGTAWLLARLGRRYGTDATPMGRTSQTFAKLSRQDADAVRARAAARRVDANARYAEGRSIASGQAGPAWPIIHRRRSR